MRRGAGVACRSSVFGGLGEGAHFARNERFPHLEIAAEETFPTPHDTDARFTPISIHSAQILVSVI